VPVAAANDDGHDPVDGIPLDQWDVLAPWGDDSVASTDDWDDAADWDSPRLEAGDWGDLELTNGGPSLEDDGWISPGIWDGELVQECTSPALAVAAVVIAVVALAVLAVALVWRSRRRPVVVVTQRPLEFPLGLGLAGGDGVVPPAKCEGSTA
jgi:hypothetical protein